MQLCSHLHGWNDHASTVLTKLKLVTKPPFATGKPHVRQPRCDTRVTPEDKQRFMTQRAAETAERRALFDAAADAAAP
jgi:hypothetical protein